MTDDKKPEFLKGPQLGPGKRGAGYGLMGPFKVDVMIVVNEKDFSEQEHDQMGSMAINAVSAWIGEKRHKDRAAMLVNRTTFKFDRRGVSREWEEKVREILYIAACMTLGNEDFVEGFLEPKAEPVVTCAKVSMDDRGNIGEE